MPLAEPPSASAYPWPGARTALGYPAMVMVAITVAWTLSVTVRAHSGLYAAVSIQAAMQRSLELLLYELAALPLLAVALRSVPPSGPSRYAALIGIPLLMCACLVAGLLGTRRGLDVVLPYTCAMAVVVAATTYRSAARSATADLLRHAARGAEIGADLARTRLRLLEAQLEPHFLFNTLATIQALARRDARAAARTLDDLMRYLADALPTLAQPHSSLADEFRLVEAYLRIQQTRMGPRLHYEVQTSPSIEHARVPVLLVYGLVENAIRHGIAPAVGGGSLTVTASRERDTLILQVSDSGRGMALKEGRSLGLASAKHRLALLYGDRAVLMLNGGSSTGLVATVMLPFIDGPPAATEQGVARSLEGDGGPDMLRRNAALRFPEAGPPVDREAQSRSGSPGSAPD